GPTSRSCTSRALGASPPVLRDRDQLLDGRVELLLARSLQSLAQHVEDLRLRAAVDEDDEAEAELLLVDLVQVGEFRQDDRIGVAALLGGRARREPLRADRGMRVQRLELVALLQLTDHVTCSAERVLLLGEFLDEPRAALEELRELLDRQLPRYVVHE